MTSLPEQLSAARSSQLEAQFSLFSSLTSQTLDRASKLAALHFSVSRDSVERSSNVVRQLFSATSPSDLLALRSHAEEQFRSLVSYGREFANITGGVQVPALRSLFPSAAVAPVLEQAANTVAAASAPIVEAVAETAKAVTETAQAAPAAAQDLADQAAGSLAAAAQPPVAQPEPVVVVEAAPEPEPEPEPVASTTPIAKAAGNGEPKAAQAAQPAAAPVPEGDEPVAVQKIEARSTKRRK